MPQNKKSQAGNVFIIILAGVVLFGALMFTFSRSANKGSGNLSKQQAKIAAQEMISYAKLIEGAVDRVRRNGCSENEINFNNAVLAGYSNTNAPVDGSCDIFSQNGGKANYGEPDLTWIDRSLTSSANYLFVGTGGVAGVGTAQSDLLVIVPYVDANICIAINEMLGINNPSNNPPVDDTGILSGAQFTGTFDASPAVSAIIGDSGSSTALAGATTACIYESTGCSTSCYNFYHTLLAR